MSSEENEVKWVEVGRLIELTEMVLKYGSHRKYKKIELWEAGNSVPNMPPLGSWGILSDKWWVMSDGWWVMSEDFFKPNSP